MLKLLTLVLVGFTIQAQCQHASQTYRRISLGGLCSKSITLFPDSTYNLEEGCEASSHISFGKWSQAKKNLRFFPVDKSNFSFIDTVYLFGKQGRSISVKIVDSTGANVSHRVQVVQATEANKHYTLAYDSLSKCRTGIRVINSILRISSFERLFNRSFIINIYNSDSLEIRLNFSMKNISNLRAEWSNDEPFSVERKKGRLVSLMEDLIVDFSKPPQKSKYLEVR